MKTHNGVALKSDAKIAKDQVTTEEVLDQTITPADIDPSGGTALQVLRVNAGGTACEWGTPSAGGASLSAANVWTAKQTLGKSSATPSRVVACSATRHNCGAANTWMGVSHEFEVQTGADTVVVLGDIRARSLNADGDANCYVEMHAGNSRDNYSVGLRCRSAVSAARRGAELVCADGSGTPILQPCEYSDGGNLSLTIQPQGTGNINLGRPVVPVGTVVQITSNAGIWASPVAGQMAFCSNASGGAKPCWFNGTSWVLADGTALS